MHNTFGDDIKMVYGVLPAEPNLFAVVANGGNGMGAGTAAADRDQGHSEGAHAHAHAHAPAAKRRRASDGTIEAQASTKAPLIGLESELIQIRQQFVRAPSRSVVPQWGSIRRRPLICTYTPCGVRVDGR